MDIPYLLCIYIYIYIYMYIILSMFFLCYPSYVFLFFYHLILLLIVPARWSNNLVYLHFSLHCEFEVMFSSIKMQQLQKFIFFYLTHRLIEKIIGRLIDY
jgi:hypothetical protein